MLGFKYRILVVDDEEAILKTSMAVLEAQGYEVRTARDGFEALVELRRSTPEILITDLSMPNMGGFELLSIVRKRFPQISVIVISAAYGPEQGGVIADAFFPKGQFRPEELFQKIASLLSAGPPRAAVVNHGRAPVWTPLEADSYFVVTCPDCLRSFSVTADGSNTELRRCSCIYCDVEVTFLGQAGKKAAKKKLPA